MVVNPQTTAGAAYISECLKTSRTPRLFIRIVHRDPDDYNNPTTNVYGNSEIKSFNISDSICNNSEYSIGNVPNVEFSCEIFSTSDDTSNVIEMEVFFCPFDDPTSTLLTNINATAIGNAPSNTHLQRIGTFYAMSAYSVENIMYFKGTDAIGWKVNQYYPESDGLTYPVTAKQLLNTALAWSGLNSLPGTETFVNLNDISISEQPTGYTIRQILEMCCSFEGANLVHMNDYFSNSGATYDMNVRLMYPGRYTYRQLNGQSIQTHWLADSAPVSYASISDSNIFKIKRLQKPILFAGVQYAGTYYDGTGAANGSTYYLDIPQNEIMNNMSNADIATYMNKLADLYKGWEYVPLNATVTSVPFVQHFDRLFFPGQNLVECVVTSTNFSSLGAETVVTAGDTVPQNDYRYTGKGVSRYDKNAALLNRLYKFLYPGSWNLGIGGYARGNQYAPYQLTNYFTLQQLETVWFNGEVNIKDASDRNVNLNQVIFQRSDSITQLYTQGWYRIFECDFLNANNAVGKFPEFVDIAVRTEYYSSDDRASLHMIKLAHSWKKIEFVDEISKGYGNSITKIRFNTNSSGKGFIDVYYNNVNQYAYSSADLVSRPYMYLWKPTDYTAVASSPSGETTQATYDFVSEGQRLLPTTYLGNNQLKYITHQYLRTSTQLSSAGWYRIASWDIGASTNTRGGAGITVDFVIASQYQATNNCLHRISLIGVWDKIAFVDETSTSNTNGITKIRYTRSTSNSGAIDIYYNLATANHVRVDIAPCLALAFSVEGFTPVSASPSDETVVAEYTFDPNLERGIFSVSNTYTTTSGGYINLESSYSRSKYAIISAYTTSPSDSFVRITGSTNQWVRVIKSDGTVAASTDVSLTLVLYKL